MNGRLMLLFGFAVLLFNSCEPQKGLTERKAVKLAEQFIKDNGYTTFSADTTKLSFELFDGLSGDESRRSIVAGRYNSLNPKAFAILKYKGEWNVGFLFSTVRDKELTASERNSDLPGRIVVVNDSEIRIDHATPLFSQFRKLSRQ